MIIGVGIDIVDAGRISALLNKHGERFQQRVFTREEILYCRRMRDPSLHFSARFAAKEAAYKCQFPRSRQLLEFTDLRLDALRADAATLRFTRAVPPYAAGAVLPVRLARAEGLVIAACADPLPGPAGAADASG